MKLSGHPWCIQIGYYYTLLLGTFAVYIDSERKRFVEHYHMNIIVGFVNLLTIVAIPFAFYVGVRHSNLLYEKKSMLVYSDMCNTAIHLLIVLLTVLFRLRREAHVKDIIAAIFSIDSRYFDRRPQNAAIDRHFDKVINVKFINTCLMAMAILFTTVQEYRGFDAMTMAYTVYGYVVHNIILGVMVHYFVAMCELLKRFHIINAHLKSQLGSLKRMHRRGTNVLRPPHHGETQHCTLRQLSRLAAADLEEISSVHLILTQLTRRLNDTYKFQTALVLLRQLFNNVFYAYTMFMILSGDTNHTEQLTRTHYFSVIMTVLGTFIGIVVFVDLYMLYWCCDSTVRMYRKTSDILREFHTLPLMDPVFQNKLEMFHLQLIQHKLAINIGGMFDVNKSSSLAMWSFTLRHTFIFVQFDYESRFREFKMKAQTDFENGVEELFAFDEA